MEFKKSVIVVPSNWVVNAPPQKHFLG